jgi:hypothetical protein
MKYVWLNIQTGEFSNSWTEKEQEEFHPENHLNPNNKHWKLIKYECINEPEFEFYNMMKRICLWKT